MMGAVHHIYQLACQTSMAAAAANTPQASMAAQEANTYAAVASTMAIMHIFKTIGKPRVPTHAQEPVGASGS